MYQHFKDLFVDLRRYSSVGLKANMKRINFSHPSMTAALMFYSSSLISWWTSPLSLSSWLAACVCVCVVCMCYGVCACGCPAVWSSVSYQCNHWPMVNGNHLVTIQSWFKLAGVWFLCEELSSQITLVLHFCLLVFVLPSFFLSPSFTLFISAFRSVMGSRPVCSVSLVETNHSFKDVSLHVNLKVCITHFF